MLRALSPMGASSYFLSEVALEDGDGGRMGATERRPPRTVALIPRRERGPPSGDDTISSLPLSPTDSSEKASSTVVSSPIVSTPALTDPEEEDEEEDPEKEELSNRRGERTLTRLFSAGPLRWGD